MQHIIHHRLQITTLTPVSIGADEADKLSPYADFVFSDDGSRIIYIDRRKLEKAVLSAGLMDEYVASISNQMDNNRADFDLGMFIRKRLNMKVMDIARFTAANQGISPKVKQTVHPIIKDAGRPYLPGSTLKGAIRTAILYDWLVKTNAGEPVMKGYEKALPGLLRARDDFFRLKKDYKQKRLFREFDEARRRLSDAEKVFFQEDKLFGRLSDGPESRFIRVTDTGFADAQDIGMYATRRIRLQPNPRQQGKSEIPTPREALLCSQPLSFAISVVPAFAEGSLLAYWAEKSTPEILSLLNAFTLDALRNEIYELEQANNQDSQSDIDKLYDFYQDLLGRAEAGSTFMRLGFGKTVYDNSLTLAMYNGLGDDDEDAAFLDYRRGMLGVRDSAINYPVTRTLTADGRPLGWVEVRADA
jgi:CRISPR-associated protein Csm5